MLLSSASNKQYIISLDDLDLSLLSQYVDKQASRKQLLWSRSCDKQESEYYEVTIELDEDQIDDFENETPTNLCHICNVDVPQTYFNQHINSKKHQSYKKLVDKIFENISKQLDVININNAQPNGQTDKYFCEDCSKLVSKKNRSKHKKSNYHLKSLQKQKFIDSFLELYIENKDIDLDVQTVSKNATENVSKTELSLSSQSNQDYGEIISSCSSVNNSRLIQSKPKDSELLEPKNISNNNFQNKSTDSLQSDEEIDGFIDFADNKFFHSYLRAAMLEHKVTINVPCIEGKNIIIVSPKGQEHRIKVSTFHGLEKYNNFLHCQLCGKWIEHKECSVTEHINTRDHVLNIAQPINDDFTRKTASHKGMSHCLVCNVTIKTESKHAEQSPDHIKILNVIPSEENKVNPNLILKYCDVCCISIQLHNFLGHVNGRYHKENLKQTKPPAKEQAAPKEPIIPPQYKTCNSQGESYCDICKVNVPLYGMDVHKAGKPHKTALLKNSTETANISNNDLASTTIISNSLIDTEATLKLKKVDAYKKQFSKVNENILFCQICEANVPNLSNNIIEHVQGNRHNANITEKMVDHKLVKSATNEIYCELCKMKVNDSVQHMLMNMVHTKNFIWSNNINQDLLRKYVHDEPDDMSTIAHAYRVVHKDLLIQNKVVLKKNTFYYCNVCLVKLTRISEISHIFGKSHKILLNEPQ